MLDKGRVATGLPAQDLQRARAFYAEKLGLESSKQRPGGLLYRCVAGEFALFESAGAAAGTHAQMGWDVDDIETVVVLSCVAAGVAFEEYDLRRLKTVDGIAEVAGNYPSKGNLLGIGQAIR